MKKLIIGSFLLVALITIAFRLRDHKSVTTQCAGFWKGYCYYYNAAILNKKDGTSRLYLLYLNDTSSAYKYDGTWLVNLSAFKAAYAYGQHRLYLNGNLHSPGIIRGKSSHKNLPGAAFGFVKEP